MPFVQASLKSGRQLMPSLRTLLENAAARKEQKAYVISLSRRIFDQTAARLGVSWDGIDEADASTLEQELFLGDPEDVPPSLEQRLIGDSPAIRVARQLIVRAAVHEEPILER